MSAYLFRFILSDAEIGRAERVQAEWDDLELRAEKIYNSLAEETQPAFYELVYMLCAMQANLNRLYIEGKSASQSAMPLTHL